MTDVFPTVLRMSLTGSAVILGVLLARLALKKTPKRWSWALWLIVLFRLLTPFGIPLSVPMPDISALPGGTVSASDGTDSAAVSESPDSAAPSSGPADGAGESSSAVYAPDPSVNSPSASDGTAVVDGGALSGASDPLPEADRADLRDSVLNVLPFVWLAGAAVLAGWNLLSYRILKKRLAEAVPSDARGVYLTDRTDSAFVVGLIRPKIYLPTGLNPVERACVVAHERTHIRRGDPCWRLLSFAALTVHWFNPLVWLAFSLSGRDMEMSCDEAVLNRAMDRAESRLDGKADTSDAEIRAAYARTLLKFASRGRIAGPALAFGEGETGSRVKNVMRYRKPVLWVSVAAAVVLVLSAVVLAVNLTARDTKLPHTTYSAKEVVFFDLGSPDISEETADGLREGVGQLRWMLAGDGTLYITGPGMPDWYTIEAPGGGTVQWIRDGALVSDRIRGIDSAEEFADMIRETTGVEIGRIVDAVVSITEPYSPNHSSYDALFSTEDGKIRAASVVGRESLEKGRADLLIELEPEKGSGTGGDAFFSKSLHKPVSELLSWEEDPEVFIYEELRDRENRTILLFMAGEQVSVRIGQPDNEIPFHFGIAVFLPEADGVGLRLADCQICPDVTVTRQFRDAGIDEPQEPGTVRRGYDDFVFLTEDGQTVRAELTLPEKKSSLFGKTEYTGECSVRFTAEPSDVTPPEDASPADEAPSPDPKGENPAPPEGLIVFQPKLDVLYDAFVAEHYDPDNWQTAAYTERRIDLDRDGLTELILYRSPTEAAYPLDIYTWEDGEIRAFHTALEGIPASRNADPDGRYCAALTAGNSSRNASDPDGFYSDFFSVNGEVFLIAMDASEFWQIIRCYAFGSADGALSSSLVFSAERYGEFVSDETKKNKAFVNGQEIPLDEYGGALLSWRESWMSSMNGGVLTWFTPNEYEVSGWPFGWNAEQRMKTTDTYFPLGHLTLTHPALWRAWTGGEPGGNVEWLTEPTDGDGSAGMWIQFLFRDRSKGYIKTDTLGWLMLYPHHLGRTYTSPHQELKTAVGTSVFIMAFTALTGSISHFAIDVEYSYIVHSHLLHQI